MQDVQSRRWQRPDTVAVALVVVLVVVAALVGRRLLADGVRLVLPTPPLLAQTGAHGNLFSLVALAAGAALVLGQRRAVALEAAGRPLRWGLLLLLGWAGGLVWSVSLALANGWDRGWARVLEDPNEYLEDLPLIRSVPEFLSTFTDHLVHPGGAPAGVVALDPTWTTHVAGHPPLATLLFWWLDRAGLPGGAWAALMCVLVASVTTIGLPAAVRVLGAPQAARRLVWATALFPGVVWMAVSADGLFTGVAAAALALVSLGAVGRSRWHLLTSFGGGLLYGAVLHLNYGLALLVPSVGVALWFSLRQRPGARAEVLGRWAAATAGVAVVFVAFVAQGFWWLEGLAQLRIRYYQGIASNRPYWYFLFANLAALAVCASPLLVVGLRRAVGVVRRFRSSSPGGSVEALVPAALALAGLLAVVLADLSGMSKAETERIWLPFAVLCWTSTALLRGRLATAVLAGAGLWAFAVNSLLWTGW